MVRGTLRRHVWDYMLSCLVIMQQLLLLTLTGYSILVPVFTGPPVRDHEIIQDPTCIVGCTFSERVSCCCFLRYDLERTTHHSILLLLPHVRSTYFVIGLLTYTCFRCCAASPVCLMMWTNIYAMMQLREARYKAHWI